MAEKKYVPFEFTPEIMQQIVESREIPVHFYNKEGQILIYKKVDATEQEIDRLFRFVQLGVYYDQDDGEKLGIKEPPREIPEGLTDTKLLTQEVARDLTSETKELFTNLKRTAITSVQARRTSERLAKVFQDFESQPDAMTGLVNIIELMKEGDHAYEVELATKRTVVAMAMKSRGMLAQNYREQARQAEAVNIIMMSALLCDIGYAKMKISLEPNLATKDMNYIKNHPIMSYLLIAHEPAIDPRVKRNILVHHRPMREGSEKTNNYPDLQFLRTKLSEILEQYSRMPEKRSVCEDIRTQLKLLQQDITYDEDAAILCLASEFASLTSQVPWRKPFSARRAVQMIINNSYFTYPDRIMREFLDYVAISLCDNQKILREGDFIVMTSRSQTGRTFFEVGQITHSNRYQSRPGVDRIATVDPIIETSPKLRFAGFDLKTLKPDPRFAHFELSQDDTRHIVYAVNPNYDEEFFNELMKLVKNRYRVR
jgi:HD-GYP domain-containing protein (c-di-GMP phosphodiesterase class II)